MENNKVEKSVAKNLGMSCYGIEYCKEIGYVMLCYGKDQETEYWPNSVHVMLGKEYEI